MKPITLLHLSAVFAFLLSSSIGCAIGQPAPAPQLIPRTLEEIQSGPRHAAKVTGAPTTALVLGGGGLRGFAHIGVLRALEEAGLHPDIVVGTSAGSIVGAAYASGLRASEIERIAHEVKISSLIDFTFSRSGLMRGDNIASWVDTITSGVPIERFPRRFAAVATDLGSGNAVLLDQGSPGRAVQASSAVPGPNVPIAYAEGHLVDGGISGLVPVRFARALGADYVIAVDIYCSGPSDTGVSVPSVLLRVMRIQSCAIAAPEMAEADLLITPLVTVTGIAAGDQHDKAIAAGYEAAVRALERARPAQPHKASPIATNRQMP